MHLIYLWYVVHSYSTLPGNSCAKVVFDPRVLQQLHRRVESCQTTSLSKAHSYEKLGKRYEKLQASGQRKAWNLGMAISLGITGMMALGSDRTIAQVVGDTTLGTESTVVTTQAYEGNGGSIRISSNRLFYAINCRDDDFLDTNDITLSSIYGRDGELELNNVDVEPTQGLTSLTEVVIDPSTLISPHCAVRGKDSDEQVNQLTVTGRGGIPPSPNDTLQNDSVETNWVTTDPSRQNHTEDDSSTNLEQSFLSATRVLQTPALVEAQGWVYGSNGEVILTAHAPTVTLQRPSLIPATSCNGY